MKQSPVSVFVRSGNCPVGELSGRGIVRSGNCPVGELPGRGIVRSGNCPVGELSGRGIVRSGNCPVGELSGPGNCPGIIIWGGFIIARDTGRHACGIYFQIIPLWSRMAVIVMGEELA